MAMPRLRAVGPWLIVAAWGLVMAYLLALSLRDRSIPESEAIRLAEEFVARNGYTDLPPDADVRKLTPEPVVLWSSGKEELEHRHDTLARKADGAHGGAGGQMVYFRCKNHRTDPDARRAVVMDARGEHIHLSHEDAYQVSRGRR